MLTFICKSLINPSRSSASNYLISENVTRIALLDCLKRFNSTKPHCNVGTIGHVDHGKTTLSSAITRVLAKDGNAKFLDYSDIDKSPEEKIRGITINACHLDYSSESRHYAHVDCPGHLSFIKNMIAGTSQMDGAILVVAATDGVMPQTREHILLTKQIGVKDVVVYINKADVVDHEMIELVKLEVADLLDEMGYDSTKVPFISGSALCALNGTNPEIGEKSIRELIKALDENIELPERNRLGQFIMPVDASFSIQNKGTVAVGTVTQGVLKSGESIHIIGKGNDLEATATELQVFNKSVPSISAGDNIGILFKGVNKNLVERGLFVCTMDPTRGSLPIQTACIVASCYIMRKSEGGKSKSIMSGFMSTMFVGSFNTSCYIEWLPSNCNEVQNFKIKEKELEEDTNNVGKLESAIKLKNSKYKLMAMCGDVTFAKIYVNHPMILEKGQKFFVRECNLTILTGMVTQVLPGDCKKIVGFNYKEPEKIRKKSKQK